MNDDVFEVLNDNTEDLPKIKDDEQHSGPGLSKSQELARQQGNLEASTGVNRSSWDDVLAAKRMASGPKTDFTDLSKGNGNGYYGSPSNEVFGAPNPTNKPGGSFDQDFEDFDPDVLHRDLLGSTAYKELKHAVGIADDESFTDYYNQNKYIPEGYGMEAKLLLAEERRMKDYQKYLAGETSKTDFLYNAYGKDFLKAQGIDLDSSLFWYNRAKKGDHSNPLDNPYIMDNVMKASEEAFLQESFVKDTSNMKLKEKLAGITTGVGLSDEQIYDLYKDEFDNMKQFFDDDIHKIITYYKSGNLSNVFNPFIDINNDGIKDYYLHIDGKLYACEGSDATKGLDKNQTAKVDYTEDGKVRQVEINDGFTGWFGALGEGAIGFFTSLADSIYGLGYSALYGITGGFGQGWNREEYTEGLMKYDALKNSVGLLNQDVQVFSGEEDADTAWARGFGMVAGIIAEQAIMAYFTAGTGNIAKASAQATVETAKHTIKQNLKTLGKVAAKETISAGIGAAVGAGIGSMADGSEGATHGALIGAGVGGVLGLKGVSKMLASEGRIKGSEAIVKGLTNTLQMTGKVRSGIPLGNTPITKMAVITGQQFFKDFIDTYSTISGQNKQIEIIKSENPEFEFEPLNESVIFRRAAMSSIASSIVSFGLRAYGDSTVTTRWKQLRMVGSDKKKLLEASFKNLSKESKGSIATISTLIGKHAKQLNWVDNIADIVENFITAGIQSAASNPYVQPGSREGWDAFLRGAVNPQTILMSAWSGLNNSFDMMGGTSIKHDKELAAYKAYAEVGLDSLSAFKKIYANMLNEGKTINEIAPIKKVIDEINNKLNDKSKDKFAASVEVVTELDKIFNVDQEVDIKVLKDSFNLTEDEAKKVEDIMANNTNVGFFQALTITKEQHKAELELMGQLNKVFKDISDNNKKMMDKFKQVTTNKKGLLSLYKESKKEKVLLYTYLSQLHNALDKVQIDMNNSAYKDLNEKYKVELKALEAALESKGQENTIDNLIGMVELQNRLAKTNAPIDSKEMYDALEKYFDIKFLNKDSFVNQPNFIYKDGKITFEETKMTEEKKRELFNKSPLLYIMALDPDSDAAKVIKDSGIFPSTQEELNKFIIGETLIQTIVVRDDKHNEIENNPDAKNVINALDNIADISSYTNDEGIKLLESQYPFVRKISYTSSTQKTDGGNNKEYTIYVVQPFDGANDLQKINTIQTLYGVIDSLVKISNITIDAELRRNELSKLGWLATVTDPAIGIGSADFEKNDYYYYKGLDIVLSMSNVINKDGKPDSDSKKMFKTNQILDLVHKLQITSEDLDKIANGVVGIKEGTDDEPEYQFSAASKKIAKEIIKHDKFFEKLKKAKETVLAIHNKFADIENEVERKKAYDNYSYTDSERKTIVELVKETNNLKNKDLVETIKREYPELENVINVFQNPEGLGGTTVVNFLEGVGTKQKVLSAPGTKVIKISDDNVKEYIDALFENIDDTDYFNYTVNINKYLSDAIKSKLVKDFKYLYDARREGEIVDQYFKNKETKLEELNKEFEEYVNSVDKIYENNLSKNRSEKEKLLTDYKDNLYTIQVIFKDLEKSWDTINKVKTNRRNIKADENNLAWDVWMAMQTAMDYPNQLTKKQKEILAKYDLKNITGEDFKFLDKEDQKRIKSFHAYYYNDLHLDANLQEELDILYSLIDANKKLKVIVSDALADKDYFKNKNKYFADFKKVKDEYDAFKIDEKNVKMLKKYDINKSLFHLAKEAGMLNNKEEFQLLFDNPNSYFSKIKKGIKRNIKDKDKQKTLLSAVNNLQTKYKKDYIMKGVLNSITGKHRSNGELIKYLKSKKPEDTRGILNAKLFILAITNKSNEEFDINKLTNKAGILKYDGINLVNALKKVNQIDLNNVVLSAKTIRNTAKEDILNDVMAYKEIFLNETTYFDSEDVVEINMLELMPKTFFKVMRTASNCNEALNNYRNFNDDAKIDNLRKAIKHDLNSESLSYQEKKYLQMLSLALDSNHSGSIIFKIPLEEFDEPKYKTFRKFLNDIGYSNSDLYSAKTHTEDIPGIIFKDKTTTAVNSNINYDEFIKNLLHFTDNEIKFIGNNHKDKPNYEYNLMAFYGINYVDENTVLDLNKDFKVTTTIKQKDSNGQFVIDYTDFAEMQKERMFKDGVAGADRSKFYNIYVAGKDIQGQDDIKSKTTYMAMKITDAVFEYLDSKAKSTAYQSTVIKLNVGNKQAKETIEKYYSLNKNQNSVFIPSKELNSEDSKDITFVINPKLANADTAKELKDSIIKSFNSNGFDIKRLLPAFTISVDQDSEFWTVTDIIKDQNFNELKNVTDIVSFANKKPHKIYKIDESEYENFIETTKGKTVKEVLSMIKNKNSNNYYLKTLEFALESSLQISKRSLEEFKNSNEEYLSKFADYKSYITLGRLLTSYEYEGKKYGDILSDNTLDEVTKEKVLLQLRKDFVKLYNENKVDTSSDKLTSDPNKSITSMDSLKFKTRHKDIKESDYELKDFENLFKALNFESNLYIDDLDDRALPEHNSILNMLSCIDEKDNLLHINLDYYFSKPISDRALFLKFLSEYSDEGKKVAETLLIKEMLYENIGDQFGSIDDNYNYIEDENSYSRIVLETIAPNAVTSSAQGSIATYGKPSDLTNEQNKQIKNLFAAKGKSFVQQKKYTKVSSLNGINEDTILSPVFKYYAEMLGKTLIDVGDKSGSAMVHNINSKESVAEMLTSIAYCAKALSEFTIKNPEKQDVQLFHGLTTKDLNDISTFMSLYSNGITRQAEYSGYLYLRMYNEEDENGNVTRKYSLSPIVSSVMDPDDAVITTLLFDTGAIDTNGNPVLRNISNIRNEKEEVESQHLLIKLTPDSFKADSGGFDQKINILDLDDDDTRNYLIEQAAFKAKHLEDIKAQQDPNYKKASNEELFVKYYGRKASIHSMYNKMVKELKDNNVSNEMVNLVKPMVQTLLSSNPTNKLQEQVKVRMMEEISNLKEIPSSKDLEIFNNVIVNGVTKEGLSKEMMNILEANTKAIKENIINIKYKTKEVDNNGNPILENKETKLSYFTDIIDGYLDSKNNIERNKVLKNFKILLDQIKENNDSKVTNKIINNMVKYMMLRRKSGKDLEFLLGSNSETIKEFFEKMNIDDDILKERMINIGEESLSKALSNLKICFYDTEWLAPVDDPDPTTRNPRLAYQIGFAIPKENAEIDLNKFGLKTTELSDQYEIYNIIIKQPFKDLGYEPNPKTKKVNKIAGSLTDGDIDRTNDASDSYRYAGTKDNFDTLYNKAMGYIPLGKNEIKVETYEDAIKILKEKTINQKLYLGFNNRKEDVDDDLIRSIDKNFFDSKETVDLLNDIIKKTETDASKKVQLSGLSKKSLQYLKEILGLDKGNANAHSANDDTIDTINLFQYVMKTIVNSTDVYKNLYNELDNIAKQLSDNEESYNNIKETIDNVTFELPKNISNEGDLNVIKSLQNNSIKKGNSLLSMSLNSLRNIINQVEFKIQNKKMHQDLQDTIDRNITLDSFKDTINDVTAKNKIASMIFNIADIAIKDNQDTSKINLETPEGMKNILLDILIPIQNEATRMYFNDHESELRQEQYFELDEHISNDVKTEFFLSRNVNDIEKYLIEAANKSSYYTSNKKKITKSDIERKVKPESLTKFNNLEYQSRSTINETDIFSEHSSAWDKALYNYSLNIVKPIEEALNKLNLPDYLNSSLLNDLINPAAWTEKTKERYDSYRKSHKPNENKTVFTTNYGDELIKEAFNLLEEHAIDSALYYMASSTKGEFQKLDDSVGYGEIRITKKLFKEAYKGIPVESIPTDEQGNHVYYSHVWRQPLEYKNLPVFKIVVVDKSDAPLMMSTTTAKALNGDFDGDFFYVTPYDPDNNKDFETIFNSETKGIANILDSMLNGITYMPDSDLEDYKKTIKSIDSVNDLPEIKNAFLDILNSKNLVDDVEFVKKLYTDKLTEQMISDGIEEDKIDDYVKDAWESYGIKIGFINSDKKLSVPYSTSPIYKDNKVMADNIQKMLHNLHLHSVFDSSLIGVLAKSQKNKRLEGKPGNVLNHISVALTKETSRYIDALLKDDSNLITITENLKDSIIKSNEFISDEGIKGIINYIDNRVKDTDNRFSSMDIKVILELVERSLYNSDYYNDSMLPIIQKQLKQKTDEFKEKYNLITSELKKRNKDIVELDTTNMSMPTMLANLAANISKYTDLDMFNLINKYKRNSKTANISNVLIDLITKADSNKDNGIINVANRTRVISPSDNINQSKDKTKLLLGSAKVAVPLNRTTSDDDSIYVTRKNKMGLTIMPKEGLNISNFDKNGLQKIENKEYTGEELNNLLLPNKKFNENQKYRILNADEIVGKIPDQHSKLIVSTYYNMNEMLDNGMSVKIGNATTKAGKGTTQKTNIVFDGIDDSLQPELIYTSSILAQKKGSPQTSVKYLQDITDSNGNKYALFDVSDITIVSSQVQNKLSQSDRTLDYLGVVQTSNSAGALMAFGEFYFYLKPDGSTIIYDPNNYRDLINALHERTTMGVYDKNAMHSINFLKIKSLLDIVPEKIKGQTITKLGTSAKAKMNEDDLLYELYNAGDLGGDFGDQRIHSLTKILKNSGITEEEIKEHIKSNKLYESVWSKELEQGSRYVETVSSEQPEGKHFASKRKVANENPTTAIIQDDDPKFRERYLSVFDSVDDLNTGFANASSLIEKITGNYLSKQMVERLIDMGILKPSLMANGNRINRYNPILISESKKNETDYKDEFRKVDKKTGAFTSPTPSKQLKTRGSAFEYYPQSKLSDSTYELGRNPYELIDTTDEYIKDHKRKTISGSSLKGINLMFSDNTLESQVDALTNNQKTFEGSIAKPNPRINKDKIELGTIEFLTDAKHLEGAESYKEAFVKHNLSSQSYVEEKQKLQDEDTKSYQDIMNIREHGLNDAKAKGINLQDELNTRFSDTVRTLAEEFLKQKEDKTLQSLNSIEASKIDALKNELTKDDITRDVKLNNNLNNDDLVNDYLSTIGFGSKDNMHINLSRTAQSIGSRNKNYRDEILGTDYVFLQNLLNSNENLGVKLNEWGNLKLKIDLIEQMESEKGRILRSKKGATSYTNMEDRMKSYLGLNPLAKDSDIQIKLKELKEEKIKFEKENPMLSTSIKLTESIMQRITTLGDQLNPLRLIQYYLPMNISTKKKSSRLFKVETADKPSYHLSSNERLFKSDSIGYGQEESLGLVGNLFRVADEMAKEITVEKDLHNDLVSEGWIANAPVYYEAHKLIQEQVEKYYDTDLDHESKSYKRLYEQEKLIYESMRKKLYQSGFADAAYLDKYNGHKSFETLITVVENKLEEYKTQLKFSSAEELFNLRQEHLHDTDADYYNNALSIQNIYQDCLATITQLSCEAKGPQDNDYSNKFLINLYDTVKTKLGKDYKLVDGKGAIIEPDTINNRGSKIGTYKLRDMNNIITNMSIGEYATADEAKAIIAQMMLQGDIYIAKNSVAQQLKEKLYTQFIPSKFGNICKKCRNAIIPMIMATPLQLIDRAINFSLFDYGTLAQCAPGMELFMADSVATVQKLFASDGKISDTEIKDNKNMQYLLRYIASSNFDPLEDSMAGGEKLAKHKVPVIKEYMDMVNRTYGKQNLIARFAYFLMMANEAEAHDYQIDYSKSGAAFYSREGIDRIKGNATSKVYKTMDKDTANKVSSMDTKIAEIIDQNIGSVNGMPYGSQVLSQYGLVFTSFPLALIRWGKNSLLSAFSSFGDINNEGGKYLKNKCLGTALSFSLLLAMQAIFSKDLRDYLFGDKDDEDEELTEEQIRNVQNVLFRGGSVQIFKSLLSGQEATSSGQSRGPISSLFDSYVANFIPALQGDDYNEKQQYSFFKGLSDTLKEQVWSKANPIIKDPIESIPGNIYLQSTSWYTPGDSWLENMQRKWTGYLMGSAQSKAFHDAYQAESYEPNSSFLSKLNAGLENAYIEKNTNIKESKSAYKNYRKAFGLIYNYYSVALGDNKMREHSENYVGLKGELRNAINNKSSADAVYNVIDKYMRKGTPLEDIKSALNAVSLKATFNNIRDKDSFLEMLTDKEENILKTALAYEDTMFPFVDDIAEDVQREYYNNRYPKDKNYNRNKLKYILNDYLYSNNYYNNSYNNNYKKFNSLRNYYKNKPNFNYNNVRTFKPDSTYDYFINAWNYGKSNDIWGNQYSNYTNSKGDKWQRRKDK